MIHTQIIIGATSYDSYSDNHLLALWGSNNAGFSNDTRLSSGCQLRRSGNMQHSTIVGKKRDPGILDPEPVLAQIRKVEARLGKLAKIRKVETD